MPGPTATKNAKSPSSGPGTKKRCEIRVSFPPDAREQLVDASWWPVLAESFREIIRENRSTLLFANSRRTAEKVTRLINEGEPEELAYSHHGSLSREIRLAVEQRLKNGELKAIVATSSLELGIDIGELDRVILIQTPPSIASAIQRIGRSGHSVGGMSRGLLYPTHGHDFLYAAVVARGVTEQDIESVLPIECPLDILAQVIVSMTGIERWDIDELYRLPQDLPSLPPSLAPAVRSRPGDAGGQVRRHAGSGNSSPASRWTGSTTPSTARKGCSG